jgi:cell wall-associated NlpC family hydrolase
MSVGAEPTPAGKAVIAEAMTWLGTPYRHQGSRKGVGCDCLGLVRGVWRHCTEKLPGHALPGDLLVFRWRPLHAAKHLGILLGGDRFIHAYEGHAVTVSPLIAQWRRKIAGVFAFPGVE